MPTQVEPGHYAVAEIESDHQNNGPRPRYQGIYGAIKGENVNQNGHIEWSHICSGAVKSSKWFTYRIGPGDNGRGRRTDLIAMFDTKSEAVEEAERIASVRRQ